MDRRLRKMPKAKERGGGKPLQTQAPDWLDGIVDELCGRMAQGAHPGFAFLLKALFNKVMERARACFLASPKGQGSRPTGVRRVRNVGCRKSRRTLAMRA
jgi:hypothetical protein